MASKPKAVDWAAIEADYRAGVKTLREIGKAHGLSHVSIIHHAESCGWTRDLKVRIRQRAAEKLARAAVKVVVTRVDAPTEEKIVEANASIQTAITLEHRADVKRARSTLKALTEELETYGVCREHLEVLAETAAKMRLGEDADRKMLDKAIDAMLGGTSFPSRVGAAHKLADALTKVVTLERTVAGIEDTQSDESIVVGALKRMHDRAAAEMALANGES